MADVAETLVGAAAPHKQISGTGLRNGVYTATKIAQNDTVTLADFVAVSECYAVVVATGVHEPVTIATNVVTLTSVTTGAVRLTVWGT